MPDFEFLLDDLVATTEPELLERPMTSISKLTIWALRAVRLGHASAPFETWLRELEAALAGLPSGEALELFFVYLSEVDGGGPLYQAILEADVAAEVREIAMGLRKKWADEARVEGRLEGRLEGRVEILLKQLWLKFGALGGPIERRVRDGSEEDHDRWTARVLTAESLDEVFAEADDGG